MLDSRPSSQPTASQQRSSTLLEAARSYDAQFRKLSELLSQEPGAEGDREVAGQVLGSLQEACDQLKHHLDGIGAAQSSMPTAQQLLTGLKRMVGLERVSLPGTSPMGSAMATPPSIGRAAKTHRMGGPHTPTRHIDFDALPSTPTLEQLGLSGHAMAVVGDPLRMLPPSSSGMDSESDCRLTDYPPRHSLLSDSSTGHIMDTAMQIDTDNSSPLCRTPFQRGQSQAGAPSSPFPHSPLVNNSHT